MAAPHPTHSLSATCLGGRHRARRVRVLFDGPALRTTCRDCGCALVRTQATRQWFYSGALGTA